MDTDLVSFRIDADLHRKAAKVCSNLGLELHEVLRALISQIARDGALPFAIGSGSRLPVPSRNLPVVDRSRLWSDLQPQISAETALTLLMRVIAELSSRLSEAVDASDRDEPLIAELTAQRIEVLALRQNLDVTDQTAVEHAISAGHAWLDNLR